VMFCTDKDQIDDDPEMVSIEGSIRATGPDGLEISKSVESAVTEFVLLSGEAMQGHAGRAQCSLTTVQVTATKPGYVWRARDPSPFVERTQDLGGCEYLRLMNGPAIFGYLEPSFLLESTAAPPQWLPVATYDTVETVKAYMQEKSGIPMNRMWAFRGKDQLEDSAATVAGVVVNIVEMTEVQLTVLNGCCREPLDGVEIVVDDTSRGITNGSGTIAAFDLSVGSHALVLKHSSLGGTDKNISQAFEVEGGRPNRLSLVTGSWLYVYGVELEDEDDSYEDDDFEDDDGAAPADSGSVEKRYVPTTCVWLTADLAQVDDEAVPLKGKVSWTKKSRENATLHGETINPVFFDVGKQVCCVEQTDGPASGKRPQQCPLASLAVNCTRKGLEDEIRWSPKDPSPLAERTEEIGGCELMRIMACPASLGFLNPQS